MSITRFLSRALQRLIPIVLLVSVWWLAVFLLDVPSRLMPAPPEVAERIYTGLVSNGDMWVHLWSTLQATLLGYILGTVLAIMLVASLP